MKKAVSFVIVGIFLMGIVLVSFFGMQLPSFDREIYATKIEFFGDKIRTSIDDGSQFILLEYDENDPETGKFQLSWRITPDDVTVKDVKFSLPNLSKDDTRVTVSERGFVEMHARVTSFVVRVRTVDGSNLEANITFRMVYQPK